METQSKPQMKIGLWPTKRDRFFVSHVKGLNEEQVAFLHSVKVGDKLKLWQNDESPDNKSAFTLGILSKTGVDR